MSPFLTAPVSPSPTWDLTRRANVPTFRIRENRTSEGLPVRSPIVTLYLIYTVRESAVTGAGGADEAG